MTDEPKNTERPTFAPLPETNGCTHETCAPHPCPFKLEIYNDDRPCTCCDGCESECAMDI